MGASKTDNAYLALLKARVAYEKAGLASAEFELRREELQRATDRARTDYDAAFEAWNGAVDEARATTDVGQALRDEQNPFPNKDTSQ